MMVLRIALFLTIVLVVVVGGHVYLYRRLFRDTTSDRRMDVPAVPTLVGQSLRTTWETGTGKLVCCDGGDPLTRGR